MAEYKLPYTGKEIEERLGKISTPNWNATESEPGYVENRTHYEEITIVNEPLKITWDGNGEGLEYNPSFEGYKVSDVVLTKENLQNATIELVYTGDAHEDITETQRIVESPIDGLEICTIVTPTKPGIVCIAAINEVIATQMGISAGTYFATPESNGSIYVASLTTAESIERIENAVHKLNKKFLPEEGITDIVKEQFSGGIGYSETSETVILPEATYTLNTMGVMQMCQITMALPLSIGNKYKVVWNGVEYICTCADFNGTKYIGDASIMGVGTSTGEPFIIPISETDNMTMIATSTDISEVTISICEFTEIIHPISAEYLPATNTEELVTVVKEQFPGGIGYSEDGEMIILPEATYTFEENDLIGVNAYLLGVLIPLSIGNKYRVIWNGVEYICTCFELDGYECIGDESLWTGGTNIAEPFLIVSYQRYNETDIITTTDINEATISIHEFTKIVHPISAEYLPAGVGGDAPFTVNIEYTDDGLAMIGTTIEELTAAYQEGKRIGAYTPRGYLPMTNAVFTEENQFVFTFSGANCYYDMGHTGGVSTYASIKSNPQYYVYEIDNGTVFEYEFYLSSLDEEVGLIESVVEEQVDTKVESALQSAKESGEFNGKDGISATHTWNGTTLSITSASGTSSADLKGEDGDSGVYIGSTEPTDPDTNVWIDPNGTSDEIVSSIVAQEVENQLDGAKADIVTKLITQIGGLPVFGTVDDNNTITVTSALADGIYVLKYENEDGTLEEIGTITIGNGETDEPTGEIDISEYGYEDNKRWSTTSGTISSSTATGYTAIGTIKKIPITRTSGQTTTITLSGITWTDKDLISQYAVILLYVGDSYTSGNNMYLKTLGDFSDVGIRGVLNDDGTITITIYDGTNGLMFDGFTIGGVGSGANAKITVITK